MCFLPIKDSGLTSEVKKNAFKRTFLAECKLNLCGILTIYHENVSFFFKLTGLNTVYGVWLSSAFLTPDCPNDPCLDRIFYCGPFNKKF